MFRGLKKRSVSLEYRFCLYVVVPEKSVFTSSLLWVAALESLKSRLFERPLRIAWFPRKPRLLNPGNLASLLERRMCFILCYSTCRSSGNLSGRSSDQQGWEQGGETVYFHCRALRSDSWAVEQLGCLTIGFCVSVIANSSESLVSLSWHSNNNFGPERNIKDFLQRNTRGLSPVFTALVMAFPILLQVGRANHLGT